MRYGPERLRSRGAVWLRRFKAMLIVAGIAWVLGGSLWVGFLVGSEGRGYLRTYLWSSYLAAGGLETADVEIAIDGERRHGPAPKVRDWLRENVYEDRTARDLFEEWVWAGFLVSCSTIAGLLLWTGKAKTPGESDTLRGRKLVSPATLAKRIQGERSPRILGVPVPTSLVSYTPDGHPRVAGVALAPQYVTSPTSLGIHIARIHIPEEYEPHHLMFLGDTGQGKSSVVREILFQLRGMEQYGHGGPPVVIYDPDREFIQEFYVEGIDTILNPCDARSPAWDMWAELESRGDLLALAKSLIPESDHQHKEYFNQGARAVLIEVIKRCETKDPRELVRWLTLSDAELAQLIEGTPAAKFINPKAPQQAAGVTSTLAGWIEALDALPLLHRSAKRWSATKWMAKPRGWLFLTRRESDEDAVLPLHTVWLDTLIRRALDRPMNASPVWFVLDEITTVRKLTSFPKILERGRKRSVRVAFCTQAGAQVEELYGRRAKAILSQAGTQLLFRVKEPSAAKWASECIGEREYLDEHTSLHVGERESINIGEGRKTSPVVLPSEIQSLKKLTAYFVFEEWASLVAVRPPKHQPRVPDFVPRPDFDDEAQGGDAEPAKAPRTRTRAAKATRDPASSAPDKARPKRDRPIPDLEASQPHEEEDVADDPLAGLRID
jgi:hypothetical protein